MKQSIKMIVKLEKFLQRKARTLKGPPLFDFNIRIVGVSDEMHQLESNGKTYHYPETIEVNLENWSTSKFSVRTADNRWLREGTPLDSKGLSLYSVARGQIRELIEWKNLGKK